MTYTVVLADDQPLVRAGIAMLLDAQPDIQVVGEAGDGQQAIDLARTHRPDVVVMDIRMPGMDGAAATRQLTEDRSADPDHLTKVLMLTTFDDADAVQDALRSGASGFLLKHAAPQDLPNAVREVASGRAWIDPAIGRTVIAALTATTPLAQATELTARLTPREREVFTLVAQGLSNADICSQLFLSEATVKTHVARILMKTGARDRAQAVALAYTTGFLRPSGAA